MNLKKYLQQLAENDAESFLTEEDELFIEKLVHAEKISDIIEKPEMGKEENDVCKTNKHIKKIR